MIRLVINELLSVMESYSQYPNLLKNERLLKNLEPLGFPRSCHSNAAQAPDVLELFQRLVPLKDHVLFHLASPPRKVLAYLVVSSFALVV